MSVRKVFESGTNGVGGGMSRAETFRWRHREQSWVLVIRLKRGDASDSNPKGRTPIITLIDVFSLKMILFHDLETVQMTISFKGRRKRLVASEKLIT